MKMGKMIPLEIKISTNGISKKCTAKIPHKNAIENLRILVFINPIFLLPVIK